MSRTWFIADKDDVLIQFQDDRIIFNWRKRPEAGDYRRYPYVIEGFNTALDTLHSFVEDYGLGAIEHETKLHGINQGRVEDASLAANRHLFPPFAQGSAPVARASACSRLGKVS